MRNRKKLLSVIIALVAISAITIFVVTKNTELSSATSLETIIRQYVISNSAASITDISITGKTIISDAQGVQWLKFQIEPIPADAADPAYGIMKMVSGTWVGMGYGTCCIEKQLPQDVAQALGFLRQ